MQMLDITIAVSNFINSIPEESIAYYTQLVFYISDKNNTKLLPTSDVSPSLKNDAISQYIYSIVENNKFPRELFINDSLSAIEQQHKFIKLVSVCDSCFSNFKKRFDASASMMSTSLASFKEYLRSAISYYIIGYIIIIYYIPNALVLLSSKTITDINNNNEKESSLEIFTQLILLYKQEFSLNTIRSQVEDFINKHKKKQLLSDPKYIPTIKKRKSTKSYLTDYGPDYYDEENVNNNTNNTNNNNTASNFEDETEFLPDNVINPSSNNNNNTNSISLISCKHLQKILENKKKNIALVDLRSSDQFNKNHISNKFIMNLDPLLIKKMYSADELERSLRQSLKIKASVNTEPGEVTINLDAFDDDPEFIQLKKTYNYFKQRHKFSYIVIYTDEKTWIDFNNSDSSYNYIQHFYDLIYNNVNDSAEDENEVDPEKKLKRLNKKPRVLDGGFESWLIFLESQNENVYIDSRSINDTNNYVGLNKPYNNEVPVINTNNNDTNQSTFEDTSESNVEYAEKYGASSSNAIPSRQALQQKSQYDNYMNTHYNNNQQQQNLKLKTSAIQQTSALNGRKVRDTPPPVPGKSPIGTIKPKFPINNNPKKPAKIPPIPTISTTASSSPPIQPAPPTVSLSSTSPAQQHQQQKRRKSPINPTFDKSAHRTHTHNHVQQTQHNTGHSPHHHHRRGASNNGNANVNNSGGSNNVKNPQPSNLTPYQAFLLKDAPRQPSTTATPISSLSPQGMTSFSGMAASNNPNNGNTGNGTMIAPEPSSIVKVPPVPVTYNSVVRAPALRPPQSTNLIINGDIKPPPIPNTSNISGSSGYNNANNMHSGNLQNRGHAKAHSRSQSQSQDAAVMRNPLQALSIVGLKNSGNTCYINSLIQCIFAIPEFRHVFMSSEFREFSSINNGAMQPMKNNNQMISTSICTLFNKMHDYGGVIISPSNFLSKCNKMRPDFQIPNLQQDTAEFLIFLLDSLHEEMNQNFKLMAEKYPICVTPALDFRDFTTFDTASRLSINVTDREIKDYSKWFKSILDKSGISPISLLFQGQLESCLRCVKCSNISKSFSIFSVLSLPIIEKTSMKKKIRLEDCIKLFTADEVLSGDNAWDCPNCKKKELKLKEINEKVKLENEMYQRDVIMENNATNNKKFFDFKKKKKSNVENNDSPGSAFESEESGTTSRLEKFKSLQITGTKTIKSLKFLQLPEVLVINVSRFSFNKYGEVTSKNNSNIIFPIILDIKVKDEVLTFKLFAFINHYGNLKSGHYTSVVNKSNNSNKDIWCYFDDENFKFNINPGINFTDKTISSSDVYVMFYQKMKSII